MNINRIFSAYIDCALWCEGEMLKDEYSIDDIAKEDLQYHFTQVQHFVEENEDLLKTGQFPDLETQIGHDLWLTRNHHGAGFWESEWGNAAQKLTDCAHALGTSYVMIGNDGRLTIS